VGRLTYRVMRSTRPGSSNAIHSPRRRCGGGIGAGPVSEIRETRRSPWVPAAGLSISSVRRGRSIWSLKLEWRRSGTWRRDLWWALRGEAQSAPYNVSAASTRTAQQVFGSYEPKKPAGSCAGGPAGRAALDYVSASPTTFQPARGPCVISVSGAQRHDRPIPSPSPA